MINIFVRRAFRNLNPERGTRFLAFATALVLVISSVPCRAETPPPAALPDVETTAEGIGLQAASVLSSVVYLPFKCAMALAGGLAGGIAYGFSLGDMDVAESVWGPSVYGTYLLTPEHLTGNKPIEFFGSVPPSGR